jgi:hypothetical protein
MLHCGAEEVDFDALRALETPPATATHVPIPHFRVVDMLRHTLSFYGHEITDEHHGITGDGMRYFGLLSLRSSYGGYEDTVGLRNSHDKKFPVGISFGSRVFVCDNLSFIGDHVIKRRHTANAKRDLPALVGELVEPLSEQREAQHRTFVRYEQTALTDERADHAIMEMYRDGVINVQRIPEVVRQWDEPEFEDWGDRTAWRLFNAATFALSGRIAEKPQVTRQLHNVIDGVCEVVH